MQFKKVPLSIEQKTASREAVSNWNCKMQFLDDFSKELHFRLQTLRKTTFSASDTKLHYSIAYKIVLHSGCCYITNTNIKLTPTLTPASVF